MNALLEIIVGFLGSKTGQMLTQEVIEELATVLKLHLSSLSPHELRSIQMDASSNKMNGS